MLVFPFLLILFVAGIVFLIVGFCTEDPLENRKSEDPYEFTIPHLAIRSARLEIGDGGVQGRFRAGGGQVARLDLTPVNGELIRLALPTDSDLETVEHHIRPLLGRRMAKEVRQ